MKFTFSFLLSIFLAFAFSLAAEAKEVVRVGVLAYQPQHVLDNTWGRLHKTLDRQFDDYTLEFVYLNHQQLNEKVSNRSLDFVFTTPGHYIYLNKRYGLSSPLAMLLKQQDDQPLSAYGGVIFTQKYNSEVSSIQDLADRKIATIGTGGLGGYQVQAYAMLKAGLKQPEQKHLMITGQPHDRVVNAVLNDDAEVGFVRTGILERMVASNKLDINAIKIINPQQLPGYPYVSSTPLYPEWPLAALPQVNHDLTRKLTGFLFSLDHGVTTFYRTGFFGFDIPASYEGVDKVLRALKAPPYEFGADIELIDIWQKYTYQSIVLGLFILGLIVLIVTVARYNRRLTVAHQTISKQSQTLNDVIASSHVIVWIWDVNKGEVKLNKHWSEITGYDQMQDEAVSSEYFFDLMHPLELKRTRHKIDQLFRRELNLFESEIRLKDQFGNWIWVLARGRVIDWGGKDPVIVSGTMLDITKNKEYEIRLENEVTQRTEELITAKEVAEKANREKSRFLANMSHELRTPMHAILSFSALGLKKSIDDKALEYFNKIRTSGDRLLKLLNDLLDLSKLESGKLTADFESTDLVLLVKKSLDELDGLISDKSLEVQLESTGDTQCEVDKKLVQQLIINLLSNAIKFSLDEGTITVQVIQLNNLYLQLSVSDEGVGIPKDELKEIFDKFVQSSKTRSGGGGTGLGLPISLEIIKLHKGKIWAESPPKGCKLGSTFVFQIPVHQEINNQSL